ncbi:GvpL/GvpF family gas vesicle protein [Nocardioides sp. JQ2195]|uniref:GvpL/GvpF family gas vesicle protein n=1 Tax=Nocardioides sp. JQ2195 TaxID=2592334 RepID=UPI00143E7F15|nr:GvpL/GvpF family gas vesicle protein [Nocardioides sp. JQ2195]QIX27073.1 GvpL/GvpF family gas vesicle protein [Nocardioides sp. JQ2195]
MGETARYLYAITRRLPSSALSGTTGLGRARLDVVEHQGLAAVVSDVDLDEYGEEPLRENFEQLEWLEEVARTHDAVIQAVTALGATAPLRIATICLDDEGVRQRLDEWGTALEQVLANVEGRLEWSVKVFAPPAEREPTGVAAGGGLGGAEYLRRKRAATQARSDAESVAAQVGDEIHDALSAMSVASRRLHPQDPRLTGHAGTMLLNGAYLIDADDGHLVDSRVRDLAEAHPSVEITCAGPWPPYSFAMLEQ